jgi:hypothetical protein
MTESIATTTDFNMPVDEIIEMALEGLGGEKISAKEAKLARTALNLTFIEIQNKGSAPLSSLELVCVDLVSGSSLSYPLGSDVFNVRPNAVIKVSSSGGSISDINISRISHSEWLEIPTKASAFGRPTQFMVDRQQANTFINVWPVPNSGQFTFKAWTLKKIKDVNASYQLVDFPSRYLPAIIKGLRFHMADLRGVDINQRMYYKQEYMESLQNALDEDRDRTPFEIYPMNRTGLNGD